MSTGSCVRCGSSADLEYGPDGLGYCNNCAFYGLNKQCSRCRMYLPQIELQQYRGQLLCPYCVQDSRDEDTKKETPIVSKPIFGRGDKDASVAEPYITSTVCERCSRESDRLFIWNGRRLCKQCLEIGQKNWTLEAGTPATAGRAVQTHAKTEFSDTFDNLSDTRKKDIFSVLLQMIERTSQPKKIGNRQKPEIVSAIPGGEQKKKSTGKIPNLEYARPMAEEQIETPLRKPAVEIIRTREPIPVEVQNSRLVIAKERIQKEHVQKKTQNPAEKNNFLLTIPKKQRKKKNRNSADAVEIDTFESDNDEAGTVDNIETLAT